MSIVLEGIYSELMTVTPEMAAEWLARNRKNRTLTKSRVDLLAKEILDGKWIVTHQGIAFYFDDDLADGQHRLAAIVQSGVAVEILVTRGLPKEAIHAIDKNRPRSTQNTLHFLGLTLANHEVAACRVLWMQYHAARAGTSWNNQAVSTDAFATFASQVMPAVRFAAPPKKCRGLSHASVIGAIASAWFTQNREALVRFMNILHGGVGAAPSESAAITLRDYLLTTKIVGGGIECRKELFLRSCTAMRAFLEGRSLSKLYKRPDSVFPIPEMYGL